MVLLFIALFYFSPGFSTPLFYKQTDELHFSKQAIGNLGVFGGSFGILDSERKDVRYENWRGHKLDRKMLELLREF